MRRWNLPAGVQSAELEDQAQGALDQGPATEA